MLVVITPDKEFPHAVHYYTVDGDRLVSESWSSSQLAMDLVDTLNADVFFNQPMSQAEYRAHRTTKHLVEDKK